MQFPLGITPDMRTQFDYIFLLAEDFYSNLKRIYDHYAGMFPTFESFRQIFTQLTDDYGCMVIVNTTRDNDHDKNKNNFLNKIYWYKAEKVNMNNICCKQFNKFHYKNYNENWKQKNIDIDVNEFCFQKKKDKSIIKIEKV